MPLRIRPTCSFLASVGVLTLHDLFTALKVPAAPNKPIGVEVLPCTYSLVLKRLRNLFRLPSSMSSAWSPCVRDISDTSVWSS